MPTVQTRTVLSVNRINWNPWRLLDVGVENRLPSQRPAGDRRQGWLDELSRNDRSVHGWFLRVQGLY